MTSPSQPTGPSVDSETLASELTAWVEAYAKKVCPEGCLPTPGQEREINLFARIFRALSAPRVEPVAWRCFFCDEVFTDAKAASDHFGDTICADPLCKVAQIDGDIAHTIAKLAEQLHGFQIEDNASCREFYALGADHRAALIREEQKGYDRGLADGRAPEKRI